MNNIKLLHEVIYSIRNQQWNYHSWKSDRTGESEYIVSATVTEFSVQAMGGWKFVH